ncbi:Response regulator protein TodT [Pseudobythopirellula maris]|uniref:Response regulator protein TodT n=1 Tax=Pseudobythopirellula maris TaxID=2527991 RepID=A0A5C5ZRM5_9BACT|nr:response regulator [Pseudobythopirellula maris]TWT89708.1 Response regulator protein TodT [Pseudobythopirellula maris]
MSYLYVVDDDRYSRDSVVGLGESMGLTCQAFDSADALLRAPTLKRPGCLVLDIMLEGMSGIDLQSRLAQEYNSIPVIMMSGYADVSVAVQCMEAGAVTLIEKPSDPRRLERAIREGLQRDQKQQKEAARFQELSEHVGTLTSREQRVLDQVVHGRLNKSIARELDVSVRTVEGDRAKILKKFNAATATELASMVTEHDLLEKQRRGGVAGARGSSSPWTPRAPQRESAHRSNEIAHSHC